MSNKFLKGVDLNEGRDRGYFIPNLVGEGTPSEQTEGAIGSQYMDTQTGNIYICTAVSNGTYIWESLKGEGGLTENAVLYTMQTLAEEQKTQARENIGAAADSEVVKTVNGHSPNEKGEVNVIDDTVAGPDAWSGRKIALSKASAIVQRAEGELLSLNDGAEAPFVGLSLYGKTTQFTTTGKNLFDKENAETVGGYVDPDGKVAGNASIGTTWFVPVSENTKYTISTNSSGGFYFKAIRFLDAAKSLIGFDAKDTNTYGTVFTDGSSANYFATATFTTPEGCKYVQVGSLLSNWGSDSTIMLNYGDTALPYEPYTGGMASPNPDYPQELVNIGVKNYLPKTEYTAEGTGADYYFIKKSDPFPTLPAGDYILSFNASTASLPPAYVEFYDATGTSILYKSLNATLSTTLPITLPSEATSMSLSTKASFTITNATLTRNGGGNIGVTVTGKNLLPKASTGSKSDGGITFTSNGDGSYSVKGKAEKIVELFFPIEGNCVIVDGLYEHLMNNVDTGHNAACLLGFSDGKNSSLAFTPANRIAAPTNHIGKTVTKIGVHVQSGATIDVTFSPMLVLSDTATDFEPYIAQTLTASTPKGLPGIPVSSGGNYTDENGQQWLCDEIDFARGVYVQRVKQFVVDENTSFNKHSYTTDEYFVCYASNTGAAATKACISNLFINNVNANMLKTSACIYVQSDTKDPLHFSVPISIATGTTSFKNWAIENDLCVFYPLAEADYHELSTQELEVYAKLHTNKPNTIVLNDAGAGMAVGYVVDTKTYIDNVTPDESDNAELQDIRVGWDGTQYPTAGDAIRSQVKHYVQSINNGVRAITPSDYMANLTVTQHEGVVSAKYTKPEDSQASYTGFSITLGKTGEQLIGKRVIIMLDKVINLHYIALSPSAGSWQTVVKFTKDSNTEWHIDVTENDIETLGTGNIYLIANVNPNKSWEVLCTAYVIDANVFGLNMANSAFFAHKVNPDNIIDNAILATNAGYSYIKETAYIGATNNDGYANVTKNHVELMVGNATGSTFYTRASFDISQIKDNIKYIIFKGDTVNSLYITRTKNDWSQVIKTLTMGINDVTKLDLSKESQVYLLIGNYGLENAHSELDYYIITKENMVIASHSINELISTQTEGQTYITCWGDSLTAQGGWTNILANLSGRIVNNAGTGGENSSCIMARQGGDVMMINNITIPADATPVQVATYNEPFATAFGKTVRPLLQGGGGHVNPVTIAGVEGTLKFTGSTYNDSTGVYTFTRMVAGDAVSVNRPTAVVTKADKEWNNPHLMIIFMGQNDGNFDVDELVNKHRLMIDHAHAKNVVVLGLSSGSASYRETYETAMHKAFGRHFISLREYLSEYGLADAGLTPTEADTTAMDKGEVPPQLLKDTVHYTDACKTVIGNMLYKKCCELGIF